MEKLPAPGLSSGFRTFKHAMDQTTQITSQIHGTCVAIEETAVVFLGPPGSGKSDLALRLIDDGALLIADDRIDLSIDTYHGDKILMATAPQQIAGLLEVRGIGIARIESKQHGTIALAFEMTASEHIERLPQPSHWEMLGLQIPLIKLDPFALSACAKVRLAVKNLRQPIIIET